MTKSELQVELNIEKDINKFNGRLIGVLACLVISLALLAFTKCYHLTL